MHFPFCKDPGWIRFACASIEAEESLFMNLLKSVMLLMVASFCQNQNKRVLCFVFLHSKIKTYLQ
jgi:hypothetical protein